MLVMLVFCGLKRRLISAISFSFNCLPHFIIIGLLIISNIQPVFKIKKKKYYPAELRRSVANNKAVDFLFNIFVEKNGKLCIIILRGGAIW